MNKKLTIYALALSLLILSVAGVAYAHWTKVIVVQGHVTTGSVCWEWDPQTVPPVDVSDSWYGYKADMNFIDGIFYDDFTTKDIGKAMAYAGADEDTFVVRMWNTYPMYATRVETHVHYCGSVPGKLRWIRVLDASGAEIEIYGTEVWGDDPVPNKATDSAGNEYWVLKNGYNFLKIGDSYPLLVKWTEAHYQMEYCQEYEISFHIACLEPLVQDPENPPFEQMDEWEYELSFEYEVINYNEYFVQHPVLPYVPPEDR